MSRSPVLAMLAAIGCGTALQAAVRETVTIPEAQSDGRIGAAVNGSVTAALTGSWDNGGTPTEYTVRRILVDGTLMTAFPNEAQILITPPSGVPFIFNPRPAAGTLFSGRICIPVGVVTTAGTWTFRFYDSYDDAGVDAEWSNLSFGFDDAAPETGFIAGSDQSVMLSDVLADGTIDGGYVATGFAVAPGPVASRVRITGNITALNASATTNTTALSALINARFVVIAPDGTQSAVLTPVPASTQSSTTFTAVGPLSVPVAVAGGWTLRSFSTADLPQVLDSGTGAPITGSADAGFRNLMISFLPPAPPPASQDLGTFNSTIVATETVVTAIDTVVNGSAIKWYRFTIPVVPAGDPAVYLDLDTEGTAEGVGEVIGGLQDTELGLYTSLGARMGDDDDDGNGYRSALSYGSTSIRTAIPAVAPAAAGLARNGRDLGLPAGTYYASVTTYNSVQNATDFDVVPDGTRAGTVGDRKFNIRTNLTLVPSCTCCNLSNVAGPNQSTTPDDALTADDIIVFLGWFFANDARANIAGANQSTIPDNALTADDIIVFLGRYFAGC